MIDIKKAKVKFLSRAYQGALVDYPNKEKRNEALNAIHSEQKGFIPVGSEEYLIGVPSYWNWSRLGYITQNHGQKVPETDFCYIDVGTLDNIHQRLPEKENLVTTKDAPSRARKIVQFGDVLYSTVRPYLHNICIIDKVFSRTPIASTAFCVMDANESVLVNKYLFYWLLTPEFDKYSNGDPSKGALYPAIGENDLLRGVIPLPSVDEQRLIVEKVEQAFSVLDIIDELQKKYADNMTVLKSKLIDLAIRGKLTVQLPEDGTAEELYRQIQSEKQALIKAGKIKKEKPLPEINESEIPFEIPNNWKWVRVGTIGVTVTGGTPAKSHSEYYGGGYPFYKPSDLDAGNHIAIASEYLSETGKNVARQLQKGSILICCIGSIGKCAIIDKDGTANQQINALTPILSDSDYLLYAIGSGSFNNQLNRGSRATTVSIISKSKFDNCIVPLPPLAEQRRIVARLDKLLAVCDELK